MSVKIRSVAATADCRRLNFSASWRSGEKSMLMYAKNAKISPTCTVTPTQKCANSRVRIMLTFVTTSMAGKKSA